MNDLKVSLTPPSYLLFDLGGVPTEMCPRMQRVKTRHVLLIQVNGRQVEVASNVIWVCRLWKNALKK